MILLQGRQLVCRFCINYFYTNWKASIMLQNTKAWIFSLYKWIFTTHTHSKMRIYIYTYIYIYIYIYIFTTRLDTYTHTQMHIYIFTTRRHTHTHTHTPHTHTHTHTHTQTEKNLFRRHKPNPIQNYYPFVSIYFGMYKTTSVFIRLQI